MCTDLYGEPANPAPLIAAGARSILFVCLGNICRSPAAEGVFLKLARERGLLERFTVDSCGTGNWHAGELADPRTRAVAARRGIELVHRARQFVPGADPTRFDLIVAMDHSNLRTVIGWGAPTTRTVLMRAFEPESVDKRVSEIPDVPDPYEGPEAGFERVHDILEVACHGLLEAVLAEPEASPRDGRVHAD